MDSRQVLNIHLEMPGIPSKKSSRQMDSNVEKRGWMRVFGIPSLGLNWSQEKKSPKQPGSINIKLCNTLTLDAVDHNNNKQHGGEFSQQWLESPKDGMEAS